MKNIIKSALLAASVIVMSSAYAGEKTIKKVDYSSLSNFTQSVNQLSTSTAVASSLASSTSYSFLRVKPPKNPPYCPPVKPPVETPIPAALFLFAPVAAWLGMRKRVIS